MNVNGIPPVLEPRLVGAARVREARELESQSAPTRVGDRDRVDATIGAPTDGLRPAALRAASLWDVLSPEERAFFADSATLGALTYRPGGRTPESLSAPVGARIDLQA